MQQHFSEEDIRLVDVLESFKNYLGFLLRKWYISILGVVGLTFGGYYLAKTAKPTYIANISFNAVDSRVSSMGGVMSLMGVTFAGGSSNDVLSGIFTSRNIFINTLLTETEINGKVDKIGNVYMHALKYDEGFDKDPVWKNFKFKANNLKELSRSELEMFSLMYADYFEGFMVAEYDVLTGMIKVEIETPDYELSRKFGSELLKNTVQFYQNKQVENAKISFNSVSRKLDSINNEILKRQRQIASSQDHNIFNTKRENVVDQQKLMQEIATLTVQYNEASTSKENAKVGLVPQNNIVRVVDDPLFSTAPKHPSKLMYSLIGFVVSLVFIIIPLLIKKALIDGREEDKQNALKLAAQQTTIAE